MDPGGFWMIRCRFLWILVDSAEFVVDLGGFLSVFLDCCDIFMDLCG